MAQVNIATVAQKERKTHTHEKVNAHEQQPCTHNMNTHTCTTNTYTQTHMQTDKHTRTHT